MAFCKTCGNQISDQAVMCPMCGTMVSAPIPSQARPQRSSGNIGWAILGFFIPLAGLILFLVWRNDRPGDAKMAGIGALIGFVLNIISSVFSFVIGFLGELAMMGIFDSYYY